MRAAALLIAVALAGCGDPVEPGARCRTGIEATDVLMQVDTFPAPCEVGVGACVCMG